MRRHSTSTGFSDVPTTTTASFTYLQQDTALEQAHQELESTKQVQNRKKGTACTRCRSQKIRCDNGLEPCTNCIKAIKDCQRPTAGVTVGAFGSIQHLEARLLSLEHTLSQTHPRNAQHVQGQTAGHVSERIANPTTEYRSPDAPAVNPFAGVCHTSNHSKYCALVSLPVHINRHYLLLFCIIPSRSPLVLNCPDYIVTSATAILEHPLFRS